MKYIKAEIRKTIDRKKITEDRISKLYRGTFPIGKDVCYVPLSELLLLLTL